MFVALSRVIVGAVRADDSVSFSRDIQPILAENCFACHGPDEKKREGELRLDQQDAALKVIAPGNSGESELAKRIGSSDPDEVMPPPATKRKLTEKQIALLMRWIDEGAKWGGHWAYEPIAKSPLPEVANPLGDSFGNWLAKPIDRFVLAKLQSENPPLTPSPPANRAALIRRVTLDLTGLPPRPEDVEAFENDTSPDAYEKVVERLLKSPAFGERMAWDWLDAARYADSNGYQGDRERTMWPWRDWVVKAFNENLPFDQFTVWQLAGDLLPEPTFEQRLATGFNRNHMINGEGGRIPDENRVDYVMDMSETMGTVWLGLTLNCCRCHDHKFDPLTRRDYYSLFAFFNQTPVNGGGGDPQTAPLLAAPTAEQQQRIAQFQSQVADFNQKLDARGAELAAVQADWEKQWLAENENKDKDADPKIAEQREKLLAAVKTLVDQRTKEQAALIVDSQRQSDATWLNLRTQRDVAQKQLTDVQNSVAKVMTMEDQPTKRATFMLERGLYNQPGEEVTAAVPASLPPLPPDMPANRLGLARWLVSPENPLTARVIVNRFWQQLFGVGLVKTPEDFGVQGEVPPQLDLLNWLAADFRESGWDVKRLLRQIVTSETYRQSSRVTPALRERDPENRLLARGPRFRMASWKLRDQALAASGLLVDKPGGPPVNGYQPEGVWEEATFGGKRYSQDHGDALYRRSLYTFWRRIIAPTMFFDNASRQVCTVKVFRTNTPLHALLTLNDVTYVEAARALAERSLLAAGDDSQRLDFAYRRLLSRPATSAEQDILLAGLARTKTQFAADLPAAAKLLSVGESKRNEQLDAVEHAAWTALCLALLNFDEAVTKE